MQNVRTIYGVEAGKVVTSVLHLKVKTIQRIQDELIAKGYCDVDELAQVDEGFRVIYLLKRVVEPRLTDDASDEVFEWDEALREMVSPEIEALYSEYMCAKAKILDIDSAQEDLKRRVCDEAVAILDRMESKLSDELSVKQLKSEVLRVAHCANELKELGAKVAAQTKSLEGKLARL